MSEFTPDVTRSYQLYKRAGEIIPGWTQLISRRASQFANGISPTYAQYAKGSRQAGCRNAIWEGGPFKPAAVPQKFIYRT